MARVKVLIQSERSTEGINMTVQELQQQQKQVGMLIENLAFDNQHGLLDDESIITFLTELKKLGISTIKEN